MASESTEEGTLTLTLPGDLDDWLEERASRLDVDRETVLVQLLASYQATAELDGEPGTEAPPVADAGTVADIVERELEEQLGERLESVLAETLDDHIEREVRQQVQAAVSSAVSDRVEEATETVKKELGDRVDELEAEYKEDLEDVRNRVVQVKRETDGKAPRDHSHEQLQRVAELADRVEAIEDALRQSDVAVAEHDVAVGDLDERVDDVEDRLKTLAWAVSDLKDAQESTETDAVDRIKRSAARADIDRAKCENCGHGVDVALLTDPECPHCQATVTDVDPSDGFFSKPRLLVASQLDSGENP